MPLDPTTLQAIVLGIRGANELIRAYKRKLAQAENDGQITADQRLEIEAEAERTDAEVDDIMQAALSALDGPST